MEHDVPDLLAFLVASGCRIGEAIGLTWDSVDLPARTVTIDQTVVRLKGRGLAVKSTKTSAGVRTLILPSWCVDMLRALKSNTHQRSVDQLSTRSVFRPSEQAVSVIPGTRRVIYGAASTVRASSGYRLTRLDGQSQMLMDEAGLSSRAGTAMTAGACPIDGHG